MRLGLLAFSILLLSPFAASAQSIGDLTSTDSFTVSVSPQYPAPQSTATLSFLSAMIDLTNATLSVSVGGKTVYQGSVRPVSVPLGKAGSVATVLATITSSGVPYSRSVSIQPQDVAIVAEPLSSAPVLYPGKPFVPLGGDTRIVAVANVRDAAGKIVNPATLSYSWTVDGTQIADSSGVGQQTITVASPLQYRERSVSVAVQTQDGSLVGGASLALAPEEPSVLLYENAPLLGIRFTHALSGTFTIAATEDSLYAAPFSFPTNAAPALQWSLNGSAVQIGNSITLRPSGTGSGSAALLLTASNGGLDMITASLSLLFGKKTATNFFGL